MTILITGANGQIGRELQALQAEFSDLQYIALDRSTLDMTNAGAIQRVIADTAFDACINCGLHRCGQGRARK
nr:sugar nucleotide-binding protein [Haliscomenobacter sp.]